MKLPIVYLSLFLLSCQTSGKPKDVRNEASFSKNSDSLEIHFPASDGSVKQISNKGITFSFVLGEETPFGENSMIAVTCIVKNTNVYEVNYINQSCNGLDYYLCFDSESYSPFPYMQCNATYPMISKLAPGKTEELKLQILKMKGADELKRIGIDFRAVDDFIDFYVLKEHPERVEGVYRTETKPENIIWTEVK